MNDPEQKPEQKPEANPVRLRRMAWVRELLGGISARSVGRLVTRGLLPAPVKVLARLSLWPEAEVVESVGRLLAGRGADAVGEKMREAFDRQTGENSMVQKIADTMFGVGYLESRVEKDIPSPV